MSHDFNDTDISSLIIQYFLHRESDDWSLSQMSKKNKDPFVPMFRGNQFSPIYMSSCHFSVLEKTKVKIRILHVLGMIDIR